MTDQRKTTSVTLHRTAQGQYRAQNSRGASVEIAANGEAFSPGELFLASLAACSAVGVGLMTSRRAEPELFEVKGSGHKSTEGGNHFEDLTVTFRLRFPEGTGGDAARDRIPAAIRASHDRDCTVSRTVETGTPVVFVVEAQG